MAKRFLLLMLICCVLFLGACASESAEADAAETPRSLATTDPPEKTVDAHIPMQTGQTDAAADGHAFDHKQAQTRISGAFNFFSFRPESVTYADENGNDLMIEVLTKPSFHSEDPAMHEWVNGVIGELHLTNVQFGQDLLEYARENLNELGPDGFYSYSHYVSMEIGRHDDAVASLLTLSSVYSGGAHANSVQTAYNMDLNELKLLTLEDVIIEERAPDLTQLVQSGLDEKFKALGENVLFEDYAQTIANALTYGSMTPYWYFDTDGLVIFFNQYELGPYAAGIIKVPLGYDTLAGILRPEYIPEAYEGTVSDVLLTREPEEGDWLYYVDFAEGETIYISVEGTANHVQLSEVNYVEQTMVGKSMMFSANRLEEQTTIAVTGAFDDDSTIYEVEYYDEQGGPYSVYTRAMEIMEKLPGE